MLTSTSSSLQGLLSTVLIASVASQTISFSPTVSPTFNVSNLNDTKSKCDGAFIPYWGTEGETNIALFFAYTLALFYFFGGVGIAADVFMGSIEAITSVRRKVTINAGEYEREVDIAIWNKTVSNLSLMALGSSAPEILLAIIEVTLNDFQAGDLGPGTIVGSAAFNMLIIIAICVIITPVKRVEEIVVLYITAFASVWAYLWLYLIVEVISPGICEIWEAVVTCLFFPLMLLFAYFADRGWFDSDVCSHRMKKMGRCGEGQLKSSPQKAMEHLVAVNQVPVHSQGTSAWRTELRREIRKMGRDHKNMTKEQIYIAVFQKLKSHPESPVLPTYEPDSNGVRRSVSLATGYDDNTDLTVGFPEATFSCKEDVKQIQIIVQRTGDLNVPVTLKYTVKEGTAKIGKHFKVMNGSTGRTGSIKFAPFEKQQGIEIAISNTDEYNPNSHFNIELDIVDNDSSKPVLWMNKRTKVTILDTAQFNGTSDRICKSIVGFFKAIFSDQQAEHPYVEQIRMSLRFDDGDDDDDDDDSDDEDGSPGDKYDSDRDVEHANESTDSMTRSKKDDDDDDDDDEHTLLEWVIYVFLFVPKVMLGLFTPPVNYCNGWATFLMSLFWIAVYTAICGDLAKGLGCTVGLKDAVTAITFVAFGTSVPDTFASKIAAEEDPNADPAIGNVTGSNAVNVFLGIGLSWLAGAIYQNTVNDAEFIIPDSSLGFSVLLFTVFAIVWFAILTFRRNFLGGELGGGPCKYVTAGIFCFMWLMFILLASFVEYGYIEGF